LLKNKHEKQVIQTETVRLGFGNLNILVFFNNCPNVKKVKGLTSVLVKLVENLPRRSKKALAVEACIKHFLKDYRQNSHLDENYGGAYYWNERDVQWALYSHLRKRTVSRSIGSEWCVHAEGSIERPKYVRTEKWPRTRRADLVVIDHNKFKKAWRNETDFPPYEAMIEIKMILPGWGRTFYEDGVREDIRKLEACLKSSITRNAFFILLDALDRRRIPYFQDELAKMEKDSRLVIYHWPDSRRGIDSIKEAPFRRY
jgi:hypothetical protein